MKRADETVALAQRIRASGTAGEAAKLVAELNTAAGQLAAGLDANKDGQIGWQTARAAFSKPRRTWA